MFVRSVLAVLSAPIVYGAICVPVNWLIVKLFPDQFDENWLTDNQGLLVLLVALTVPFAAAAGFVGATIAGRRVMLHAAAICLVQLAVGIFAQLQYWDALPLWYHLSFFVLLVLGVFLGALLETKSHSAAGAAAD